jgi:hypothetical protein
VRNGRKEARARDGRQAALGSLITVTTGPGWVA